MRATITVASFFYQIPECMRSGHFLQLLTEPTKITKTTKLMDRPSQATATHAS